MSLGVLEAPGAYGCAMAIGEGQRAGNWPSYGGPHYGFLAARSEFVRRMPGRIVGETVDADGRRGVRPHAADARAAHPPREGDVEHHDEPDAARARAASSTLSWLGPEGLREVGETCMALAQPTHASECRSSRRSTRPSFKEVAFRTPVPAREVVRRARERGVHPGYALGRDYEGMDDVLLVAVTEKRTTEDVDRLAAVLDRGVPVKPSPGARGPMRRSSSSARAPGGGRAGRRVPDLPVPEVPASLRRARAPRLPEVSEPEIVRHFTALADRTFGVDTGFYPLGSCTMKHNPRVHERLAVLPGFRDLHPLPGGRGRAGRARADVAAAGDPRRDRGASGGDAAAGRRLAGRAHRAHADARVLRRPRRGARTRSSPRTRRTGRIPRA